MAGFGLVFGLGWAHERLFQRGITEMALAWLCDDLSGVSWSIDTTTSLVFSEGTPSDLRRVLEVLVDRIQHGPSALPQHKITSGSDVDTVLLRNRYGYASYGLAGATRYGYQTTQPADVREWLGQIGAENCTLFAGEFESPELPLGSVRPMPEPSRDQTVQAGYLITDSGIGLSWLHDRNPTAELAARIMLSAIGDTLPAPSPGRPGLEGRFRSIGANSLHVGVVAADPAVAPELGSEIVAQLDRLRTDGPDEVEIFTAMDVIAKRSSQVSSFDAALASADRELWRRAGYAGPEPAELSADPGALREEIARQGATLLLLCPASPTSDLLAPSAGRPGSEAAAGRVFRVSRALREVGVPASHRMVLADDRITHYAPDPRTVTLDTVEVTERRPDGERVLVDRSGTVVLVDPLVWSRGDKLVSWVDQNLPVQIDRDERLAPNPGLARAVTRARPGVLLVVDGLLVLIAAIMLLNAPSDPANAVFLVVTSLLFLAGVAATIPLLLYSRRLAKRVAS